MIDPFGASATMQPTMQLSFVISCKFILLFIVISCVSVDISSILIDISSIFIDESVIFQWRDFVGHIYS